MVLRARDDPNALRACTRTGLHDALYRYNETLDGIQRGLDQYLESKRAIFPRLYFISSEELLQVLCVPPVVALHCCPPLPLWPCVFVPLWSTCMCSPMFASFFEVFFTCRARLVAVCGCHHAWVM